MDPRIFIRWNLVQKKIARKAECGGFLEMQLTLCLHIYTGIKIDDLYYYLNMTSKSAFSYRTALGKLIDNMVSKGELRINQHGQHYLTPRGQEKVAKILHVVYGLHTFVEQLGIYVQESKEQDQDDEQ